MNDNAWLNPKFYNYNTEIHYKGIAYSSIILYNMIMKGILLNFVRPI